MFYATLQKTAEADYHSRYLSRRTRNRAFDDANTRRANRTTGGHASRNTGGAVGATVGGLMGLGFGMPKAPVRTGLMGALVGGGLGYGMGYMGDQRRDERTREARQIMRLSRRQRAAILDARRAARLDFEDELERARQRRALQMQADLYFGRAPSQRRK